MFLGRGNVPFGLFHFYLSTGPYLFTYVIVVIEDKRFKAAFAEANGAKQKYESSGFWE